MKDQLSAFLISGLISSSETEDVKRLLENQGFRVFNRSDNTVLSAANRTIKSCDLVVCILDGYAKNGGDFETLLSAADHAKSRLLFIRFPGYSDNARLNSYLRRGHTMGSEKLDELGKTALKVCDQNAPAEFAIPRPAEKITRRIEKPSEKDLSAPASFTAFAQNVNRRGEKNGKKQSFSSENPDSLEAAKKLLEKDPRHACLQLKKLAEEGNTEAMILLGEEFEQGKHFPMNLSKAEKWFLRGMHSDTAEGIYQYAMFAFRQKQFDQAEEALKLASESHHYDPATKQLLHWYRNSPDEDKRVRGTDRLLDMLVEHHDPQAMIERARRMLAEVKKYSETAEKRTGLRRFLPQSEQEKQKFQEMKELEDRAYKLLTEAAKSDKSAYVELALYHVEKENYTQAVTAIQTAANNNVAFGQYLLGEWLLEGRYGVGQDKAKAVKWLRRAADRVPEAAMLLKDKSLSGYQ